MRRQPLASVSRASSSSVKRGTRTAEVLAQMRGAAPPPAPGGGARGPPLSASRHALNLVIPRPSARSAPYAPSSSTSPAPLHAYPGSG